MNKWNMKKIGIITSLGILVITAVGFGGHQYTMATQYTSLIKDANKYMEDSQYDKSIALFQQSLSYKSAEAIVRALIIKDSSLNTICEFDHEETLDDVNYFVVHVYDVIVDHTVTCGWYYVNENNGKVFDGTFGQLTPIN